jgi:hypothetical protein
MITGCKPEEKHIFMAFPHRATPLNPTIADMTRMQYGAAGRGIYGETYYLGGFHDYRASMRNICGDFTILDCPKLERIGAEIEVRLEGCAKKALMRWKNRDMEGWCAYCGVGGVGLMRCKGCTETKVWYCCKEHQIAGMNLHRHTCEARRV